MTRESATQDPCFHVLLVPSPCISMDATELGIYVLDSAVSCENVYSNVQVDRRVSNSSQFLAETALCYGDVLQVIVRKVLQVSEQSWGR